VGRAALPEHPLPFGGPNRRFHLGAIQFRPLLPEIDLPQGNAHPVAVVVGAEQSPPSVPAQGLFVLLQKQECLEHHLQGVRAVETAEIALVERLATNLRIPGALGDVLGALLRAAGLVELPEDAGEAVAGRAGDRLLVVVHHGVELDVQLAAVVGDPRPDDQLASPDAVEVAHRRLAVPVDHVHQPHVLGQHGIERPQLAAAEDQLGPQPGRGIAGPDAAHELVGRGHVGQIGIPGRRRLLRNQIAHALVFTYERLGAGIVGLDVGLRSRGHPVTVRLRVGLDRARHRGLPDVEHGGIAVGNGHSAVEGAEAQLPGGRGHQVGRHVGHLSQRQPDLHLALVSVADDLAQELARRAKGLLLGLHAGELGRAEVLLRKALAAHHHALGRPAVPRPRAVAGFLGIDDLGLLAGVGELAPRPAHAPVELKHVHLQLGQLVDLPAEILQPHVPANAVAAVHAAVLEGGLQAHVERGQGEVGLLLRDDVVGQLKHNPKALQKLVGGVHRAGLVAAGGHEGRPARQLDRLEQEPVGLEPGRGDQSRALRRSHQGVALQRAQDDEWPLCRQLVAPHDRQFCPGKPLEVSLELAGHPALEGRRLGADHDCRLRPTPLGQHWRFCRAVPGPQGRQCQADHHHRQADSLSPHGIPFRRQPPGLGSARCSAAAGSGVARGKRAFWSP